MNVTEKVLKLVKETKSFPMVITNRDFNLIEESSLICQSLENDGYQIETFTDLPNKVYGLRINK